MKEVLKSGWFWLILIIVIAIIIYGCKNSWFARIMATGGPVILPVNPVVPVIARSIYVPAPVCPAGTVPFLDTCVPDWTRAQFIDSIVSDAKGVKVEDAKVSLNLLTDNQIKEIYVAKKGKRTATMTGPLGNANRKNIFKWCGGYWKPKGFGQPEWIEYYICGYANV